MYKLITPIKYGKEYDVYYVRPCPINLIKCSNNIAQNITKA